MWKMILAAMIGYGLAQVVFALLKILSAGIEKMSEKE